MKKNFIYAVMVLIISTAVGCVEVAPTYDALQVSTSEITVESQDETTFEIVAGSGSYSVKSLNQAVATATLSGTTVTISGMQEGESAIVVLDNSSKQEVTVKVAVTKLVPRMSFVTEESNGSFRLYLDDDLPDDGYLETGKKDPNVWIDLNGNGQKDTREHPPINCVMNCEVLEFTTSSLTLYGELTELYFRPKATLQNFLNEDEGYMYYEYTSEGRVTLLSLDVRHNKKLKRLKYPYTKLKSIDLTGMTNLVELDISRNELTSVNIIGLSQLSNLKRLDCCMNRIKGSDMTKFVNDLPTVRDGELHVVATKYIELFKQEHNEISPSDILIAQKKGWKVITDANGGALGGGLNDW